MPERSSMRRNGPRFASEVSSRRASAAVGTLLGEHSEQMEDRRRGERMAGVEAVEGGARWNPLTLFALGRRDPRLAVFGAPFEEEEPVVESRRRERRGEPAAGEAQAGGIEREAVLLEPGAERLLAGQLSPANLGNRNAVGEIRDSYLISATCHESSSIPRARAEIR